MRERVEKVKETIARLELAWNDHNVFLWSSAFAETCDYINGSGHFFLEWTKEKNAAHHAQNWSSSFRSSHAKFEIAKIDFPTDFLCVAIVKSHFQFQSAEGLKENEYIITAIMEKHGPEWLIRNFQNTEVK